MIFQEALFISLKDANKFKDESERSDKSSSKKYINMNLENIM